MDDVSPVSADRIHLVTCVGVTHDLALLGHFIAHYRNLGVPIRNMHVILNARRDDVPALANAKRVLAESSIEPAETWISEYSSDAMWQRRRDVQRRWVPAGHWLLSADVDEFHEYPDELARFLARCEHRRINCVDGVLIDRVTDDGRLAAVDPGTPPSSTFPRRKLLQGSIFEFGPNHNAYGSVKMMAFDAGVLPARGGHGPAPEQPNVKFVFGRHLGAFNDIARPRLRACIPLRVHHYKWTAALKTSLEARLAVPSASVAGREYGQRVLDHLEANGQRLDCARAPGARSYVTSPLAASLAIRWYRRREKLRRKAAKKLRKFRDRLAATR